MLNLIKIRGVSPSGKWIYSFIDANIHNQKIIATTLSQFTGFNDSKDKDIYEADILQNNNGTYIVIWNIDTANFQLEDKSNHHLLPLNKRTAKEYTIIGSLYDEYLN